MSEKPYDHRVIRNEKGRCFEDHNDKKNSVRPDYELVKGTVGKPGRKTEEFQKILINLS